MPKTNKDSNYSIKHCLERFNERYGKEMTEDTYNKYNKYVKKFMKTKEDGEYIISIISETKINDKNISYILKMFVDDEKMYFVYESERDCITTFLPIDSVEKRLKIDNKKFKK